MPNRKNGMKTKVLDTDRILPLCMKPARKHNSMEATSHQILFRRTGKICAVIRQYIRLSKYHNVHSGTISPLSEWGGNALVYIQRNRVKTTRVSAIFKVDFFSFSPVVDRVKYPDMKTNRGM